MQLRLPKQVNRDISVIIVSYNTRDITIKCVNSIIAHKGALDIEIIVVDNCSSDGSADALRARFPDITVIDSPSNGGFAYGNNIGFEQCHGRYILLLNPDTELYPGSLEGAVTYMEVQPQAGIMGPRVMLESGQQQSTMIRRVSLKVLFFSIFASGITIRESIYLGDPRYAGLSTEQINNVDSIAGCFMLTRREILENVGGLNQRFFMYGEETEWCSRVRSAGWGIFYNPAVKIMHHGAASTGMLNDWKAVESARGQLLYLRFTRGKLIAFCGALLLWARDFIQAPVYLIYLVSKNEYRNASASAWKARFKFLTKSLFFLPKGQQVALPDPAKVKL